MARPRHGPRPTGVGARHPERPRLARRRPLRPTGEGDGAAANRHRHRPHRKRPPSGRPVVVALAPRPRAGSLPPTRPVPSSSSTTPGPRRRPASSLLARADALASRTRFRNGEVPLAGLTELERGVREAGTAIASRDRPDAGLWGQLGEARSEFNGMARSHVGPAARRGRRHARGSGVRRRGGRAPVFRGPPEQRGDARRRDGAVLRGDPLPAGRADVRPPWPDHRSAVIDRPVDVPLSPGSAQVFGPIRPTSLWQSVNATADFAWSGRAMAQMYQQATGRPVDGVIGIDVPGLARVLRVVGPIAVPGIAEPVSADNAGQMLLHDLYEGLAPGSDQSGRRELLSQVVEALIERLRQGDHDAVALGRELGEAAAGGHLRLWSAAPRPKSRPSSSSAWAAARRASRRHAPSISRSRTARPPSSTTTSFPSVSQRIHLTDQGTAIVRTTVTARQPGTGRRAALLPAGPRRHSTRAPGRLHRLGAAVGTARLRAAGRSRGIGPGPHPGRRRGRRRRHANRSASRRSSPGAVRDGRLQLRLVPQPRLQPVRLDVSWMRRRGR